MSKRIDPSKVQPGRQGAWAKMRAKASARAQAEARILAFALLCASGTTSLGTAASLQAAEPFNQELASPMVAQRARFGTALAVSEKTAVVGAPGDTAAGPDAGAVHVFLRDEVTGAFSVSQDLVPASVTAFDRFGGAIAVGGNLLVVGARGDDTAAPNAGAAYVFRRFGFSSPFVLTNKLVAPNGGISDGFGASVAVLGNKIAIGAPRADETAFDAGTVYTYSFDFAANVATYDGMIQDPAGRAGDGFGESLAVSPGTLAVGAARLDAPSGPQNSGGVVIYEEQGAAGMENWVKVQTLFPSQPSAYAGFGSSLAMEPPRPGTIGTLVVGAPDATNPTTGVGKGMVAVYVSALPVHWNLAHNYGLNEPGSGNKLGASVAIEDDIILAGAPGRSIPASAGVPAVLNKGSVDLIRRDPVTGWGYERTIELPESDEYWYVGSAVAMRTGYPLIGAPGAELTSGLDEQGTAWSVCYGWAPLGELLCAPAVPNSTGHAASLVAHGSDVASARNLTLEAAFLPRFSFAYALTSKVSGFSASPGGSQGNICLAGGVGRLVQDFRQAGADGRIAIDIDTGALPQPNGFASAVAGETWWFQVWYRDANPTVTSNFTDAVGIAFQ